MLFPASMFDNDNQPMIMHMTCRLCLFLHLNRSSSPHSVVPSFSAISTAKLHWFTISIFSYPSDSIPFRSPAVSSSTVQKAQDPYLYPLLSLNGNPRLSHNAAMRYFPFIHHLEHIDVLLGRRHWSFTSPSLIQSIIPSLMIKDLCLEIREVNGWRRRLGHVAHLGAGWGTDASALVPVMLTPVFSNWSLDGIGLNFWVSKMRTIQKCEQIHTRGSIRMHVPPVLSKSRTSALEVTEELTLDHPHNPDILAVPHRCLSKSHNSNPLRFFWVIFQVDVYTRHKHLPIRSLSGYITAAHKRRFFEW